MKRFIFGVLIATTSCLLAQPDTARHGYPVTPFFETHPSTGVFCEFRNTGTANHFHNGTDIPKPDGSPVYSVYDGIVDAISPDGSDAYVRVRYNVHGLNKSDAYVHILPNPLLHPGDSVRAYQTVLGNILVGQGHVHFTNGEVGDEMNALRWDGGFSPFFDRFPPRILSVRFFMNGSTTEFFNNRMVGPVDIRVQAADITAADSSNITGSTSNNGAYAVGFKVLSADRSTVVYEPPSAGVRYRFDTRPFNSHVGRVFAPGSDLSTHIYTVTNGDGADYINNTHTVNPNTWNSSTIPIGNYTLMVFAQDTRNNADTEYVPIRIVARDTIPPAIPVLESVLNDSTNRITIRWQPNLDPDLLGYRLYYSFDGVNWVTRDNEGRLVPGLTSVSYTVSAAARLFFRLAAVDSAAPANISGFSSVYGVRLHVSPTKTLVVDGFDRRDGGWREPSHPFAIAHGRTVPTDFGTCTHNVVVQGRVQLQNYQIVDWILGDESTTSRTFDVNEQEIVKSYLRSGGKLVVSGSNVAFDLDRPSGPSQADRDFLHSFLKARFAGDSTAERSVTGVSATVFQNTSLRFGVVGEGSPYEVTSPDYVVSEGGGSAVFHYGPAGSTVYAGVGYKGYFPAGSQQGGVVYMAFPFETVTTREARDTLMEYLYRFLDVPTAIAEESGNVPETFELQQNFPNPFNPSTRIRFQIADDRFVSLRVYNVLGQQVASLVNEHLQPGRYEATFPPREGAGSSILPSGIYFYRLTAGTFSAVRKMVFVK